MIKDISKTQPAKWLGIIYVDEYSYGWLWKDGENRCLGQKKTWGDWRMAYPGLTLETT